MQITIPIPIPDWHTLLVLITLGWTVWQEWKHNKHITLIAHLGKKTFEKNLKEIYKEAKIEKQQEKFKDRHIPKAPEAKG